MKALLIAHLFIIALINAPVLHAQTADEVMNKYITAMGGKEKLLTLKSIHLEGSVSMKGFDVDISSTVEENTGSRTDLTIMNKENYIIVTPTKGVSFMPVMGQTAPKEMSEDDLKTAQSSLDIQSPFVNYKEKGNSVVLDGKETIDGVECYKLKVTYKNGNTGTYYIDTTTGYIVKTVKSTKSGKDASTVFANYKQNADGYWFAYTIINENGETTVERIDTNIKVDEGIFKQ